MQKVDQLEKGTRLEKRCKWPELCKTTFSSSVDGLQSTRAPRSCDILGDRGQAYTHEYPKAQRDKYTGETL